MGVVVGQPFTIRNSDPEMLNIHATPKVNREFNMAQPTQGQVAERSFDKPELFVRLKSDLRAWMFAYICVLDHPYFAVTDTNGVFRLPSDIPPGNYLVVASHLKAGLLMRNHVTIRPGEIRSLRFDYKSEQVLPATLDLETVKRAPHGPL
jgi:hypothetical protein